MSKKKPKPPEEETPDAADIVDAAGTEDDAGDTQDDAPAPRCRDCNGENLAPLEKRRVMSDGYRVSWQNHRCDDCGATTVVRRVL